MKRKIFLLFLLTSFVTMFGQNATVYITDANGFPVTCPENGLMLTDASTLVETQFTITNGYAFVYGLTVGATYNYSVLPPSCFTNQTASTGSFVLEPTVDFVFPKIYFTPFLGSETNTVELTVTTDGVVVNIPGQIAKLVNIINAGSFVEWTGTNNNDGTWTFFNVPFGNWNVQVDNPCVETKRSGYNSSDGPVIVGCPLTDAVAYTFNVNTTEELFGEITLNTGEGFQIPITDCDANYPMQISGGNKIVDNTEYYISYTVDDVDYLAVATSYPTFNSPPQNSNEHNRIDFIPEGMPGSICTVNSLATAGSCPAIFTDISNTIQGSPLGRVGVTAIGGGFFDPSPIIGGTLTNIDTNETLTGADQFGTFVFANVPQGNYSATLQLTDCKEDVVINDIVVDCASIAAESNSYTFVTADVPNIPTSDAVYFRLWPSEIAFNSVEGASITLTSLENCSYNETQTSSATDGTQFLGVPYGSAHYIITKECYPTLEGDIVISADEYSFNEVYKPSTTNALEVFVDNGFISLYGANVRVYTDDFSYDQTQNNVGDFAHFEDVPFGNVNYEVTQGSIEGCYNPSNGTTTIDCNEGDSNSVFVSLTVSTIGDLQVSVTDGVFDIFGAQIHVYNEDLSYDETIEFTTGFNIFTDVPYGEVTYVVSQEGKTTVTETVTITCQPDNFTNVSVVLEPALGILDLNSMVFNAYSYPNPFANDFTINVASQNLDKIQYKAYDMIGRLVEHRDIEVSDLKTVKFGNNYEAGIYNVILTQGDYVKTLRLIKR